MIKSTLKIARYCPLLIQGFSNFLGLFQGIMANPDTVGGNCLLHFATLSQAGQPEYFFWGSWDY